MSHITGVVQSVSPAIVIGPDSGQPATAANTWGLDFAHTPAAGGTKLVVLHFRNASLPAGNRLEVDLGYGTDVFTAADGSEFWTRPVNVYVVPGGKVPIRYVTNGAANGGVQLDIYARGERHVGEQGHNSISNSDPFLGATPYLEPTYDPFWYCMDPPQWENVATVPAADVRARVARSVGMILSIEEGEVPGEGLLISTCSVTLIDSDTVICAGHCHTPAEALTSSVTFDYQTDGSGNRPSGYNAKFYKVKSVVRHRYEGYYDYSLLKLAEAPPGIPAIQMRPDIPAPGEQVFGVHHPNGAVKKLSIRHPGFTTVLSSDQNAVTVPREFHVSGGSSGSGLFDTAGRIVGVCSYGTPCATPPDALRYYPTASIIRDIAPAPSAPALTRDVMVVLDHSGSMAETDAGGRVKIEAARDALSLFVQLVRANTGNRLGLVSFSTTAKLEAAIAAVTQVEKTDLIGLAPFVGGKVGALTPDGATSLGAGLDAARQQFPVPGANPRSILLLTDGMENTPPLVAAVAGGLGGIDVHAVGFGTPANLDGALLTSLTASHNGVYSQAESGLALEKFFSHAFGNIFEAGLLADPEFVLPEDQHSGKALDFQVCGEEAVTIVVGWDRTDARLDFKVTTPGGSMVVIGSAGVEAASGRTWHFVRLALPHAGERDGLWQVTPFRPGGGGEFPAGGPELRYFVNVIPTGGPRLVRWADPQRYYTGDQLNPLVALRYDGAGWPRHAEAKVTITAPQAGAGNILAKAKLGPAAVVDGDTIPPRQATLAALEKEAGAPLVSYAEQTVELSEESADTEGRFEEGALFGVPLPDLLAVEGNYTFRYQATYGKSCRATRELFRSLHVEVGIDPDGTETTVKPTGKLPNGKQGGTIVIVPRDRFGNQVGPGKGGDVSIGGAGGTTVTGPPQDNGDGSYTVPVEWDPGAPQGPGLVIGQPERPPVVVHDPQAGKGGGKQWPWLIWLLLLIIFILLILLLVALLT
jgi:hypothetical protein